MRKVLVTGANGQLGRCIQIISSEWKDVNFLLTGSEELDITDKEKVDDYFYKNDKIDYVINCAAYTNVEQAEREPEKAFLVNSQGVKNIAETCKKYNSVLLHISTDYVFNGKKHTPYSEQDAVGPVNEYGKSKLLGEQHILKIHKNYFIIRTSWLYSQFGKNFYKTILEKSKTEDRLTITVGEVGTPTNANDLAFFLLKILKTNNRDYGLYNFSNLGDATWYDFAKEILKYSGKLNQISLEKTDNYPTFAQRPKYSVLDKKKSTQSFGFKILDWRKSLKNLIKDQNLS